MKHVFGAVCAIAVIAVIASGAAAQNSLADVNTQEAPVSNPANAISNFDIQLVGPVLNELGVAWQSMQDGNGNPVIKANAAGQLIFYMQPTACRAANNTDCVGLATFAYFEGAVNAQTVRAFNDRYAFVSTGLMSSEGGAYISRYDIADYGIPRGNVASSVLNFLALADRFRSELQTASQTIAYEGYAADLSSALLNRESRKALTGEATLPKNVVERHQQGFEDSIEQILLMSADKSLPRNKIDNIAKD